MTPFGTSCQIIFLPRPQRMTKEELQRYREAMRALSLAPWALWDVLNCRYFRQNGRTVRFASIHAARSFRRAQRVEQRYTLRRVEEGESRARGRMYRRWLREYENVAHLLLEPMLSTTISDDDPNNGKYVDVQFCSPNGNCVATCVRESQCFSDIVEIAEKLPRGTEITLR